MVGFKKVSAYSLAFPYSHGTTCAIASAARTVYLCRQKPKYFPQALLKERDIFKNGMHLFYSLCLKGRETLLCWSEVCWKQGCCVWVAVLGRDECIWSGNRCAATVGLLCGLWRLSLYSVSLAAKALGAGAWALLLQFWGNASAPVGLDGGYIPEGVGKSQTESAMNACGNTFTPPKLVLRQWWLAKM